MISLCVYSDDIGFSDNLVAFIDNNVSIPSKYNHFCHYMLSTKELAACLCLLGFDEIEHPQIRREMTRVCHEKPI